MGAGDCLMQLGVIDFTAFHVVMAADHVQPADTKPTHMVAGGGG